MSWFDIKPWRSPTLPPRPLALCLLPHPLLHLLLPSKMYFQDKNLLPHLFLQPLHPLPLLLQLLPKSFQVGIVLQTHVVGVASLFKCCCCWSPQCVSACVLLCSGMWSRCFSIMSGRLYIEPLLLISFHRGNSTCWQFQLRRSKRFHNCRNLPSSV